MACAATLRPPTDSLGSDEAPFRCLVYRCVVGQVFLLSLLAALNPVLVGASTVMLLLPNPKRLMFGYLLGALMTSITLGLVSSLR